MRMYRFFPHLPFYAKYGAIPESYLIALSYEEQLLWLCKAITDVDSKIGVSFEELQKYVDDALKEIELSISYINFQIADINEILKNLAGLVANKQDRLMAGTGIKIENNVISTTGMSVNENLLVDITSELENGYTYPDTAVGQILDRVPVTFEDYALVEIPQEEETTYQIVGKFTMYEIDSTSREVLVKEVLETSAGYSYTTTAGRTLVICFNTATEPAPVWENDITFLIELEKGQFTNGTTVTIDGVVYSKTSKSVQENAQIGTIPAYTINTGFTKLGWTESEYDPDFIMSDLSISILVPRTNAVVKAVFETNSSSDDNNQDPEPDWENP